MIKRISVLSLILSCSFFGQIFAQVTPSITILSPQSEDELVIGNQYDITWTSVGVENVMIQLDKEYSAQAWHLVYKLPASEGKFSFDVEDIFPEGYDYSISIWDSEDIKVKDQSEVFSIVRNGIGDWTEFKDKASGFKFSYPVDGLYKGPNISVYDCDKSSVINNCKTDLKKRIERNIEEINGVSYCLTTTSEGAAGTHYSTYKYVGAKNDQCVDIEMMTSASCGGLDGEENINKCFARERNLIKEITSTFVFEEPASTDPNPYSKLSREELIKLIMQILEALLQKGKTN